MTDQHNPPPTAVGAPSSAESRPRPHRRTLLASLAAAGLGAFVATGAVLGTRDDGGASAAEPAAVSASSLAAGASSIAAVPVADTALAATALGDLYERVSPSVVEVVVDGVSTQTPFGQQQASGQGSGFVLDGDGHVVTNAHVVAGADRITVRLQSGGELPASVSGVDESSDLAVLSVDPPGGGLQPLALADSDSVRIGDGVVAIGSPFGLESTLTSGIVSALGRTIDAPNGFPIRDAIQTDAAINHGNSGGPLLDLAGRVIGVNAQIASESGGNDGVGFAIPSNTVAAIAAELIAGNEVERAYLGVSLVTVTPTAGGELGIPVGVQVGSVVEGSPAGTAGLIAGTSVRTTNGITYTTDGDVIVAIDGDEVKTADELGAAIAARRPGDSVTLTVARGGERIAVAVELAVRPS